MLNSVFLYHCTKAGLDLAIVNAEKLERYASIPEEERKLAEDLLWNRGDDPDRGVRRALPRRDSRARRRTSRRCRSTSGSRTTSSKARRTASIADLDLQAQGSGAARHHQRPADEGHGRGRPAVQRQRADRRRGAAERRGDEGRRLAPRAVHGEEPRRRRAARCILATVKGDVHDIGKNLVDIILSNNGYNVINLGIKVPPEELIEAAQEHQPDVIGLSGLLVKSAQQMVITAGDLQRRRHRRCRCSSAARRCPTASRATKIAPAYEGTVVYCNDAMNGLDTLNRLMDPDARTQLEAELLEKQPGERITHAARRSATRRREQRSARISLDVPIPAVPDLERHVERGRIDLDEDLELRQPADALRPAPGLPRALHATRSTPVT